MGEGRPSSDPDVGLALSGGGSRAAAFHRGTLQALDELGLLGRIKTVSSVSGGSVFAASWLAARARKQSETDFRAWIGEQLARGFVRPTLCNWRVLSLLWRSRTRLLADTFDRILFDGVDFASLPASPLLCLNTTVLNNACSGRFSRDGFSCAGVGALSQDNTYPVARISGLTLGLAVAASAAFPFGLPPIEIAADRFSIAFSSTIASHSKLVLTDGGIVENLGIERLLQSHTFGTRHVISSDAGVRDHAWHPSLIGRLKSAAIFSLSAATLDRLLVVMSDKESGSMRQLLFAQLLGHAESDRVALFVRLVHTWDTLVGGLPPARLAALGLSSHASVAQIESALAASGVDLAHAKDLYTAMGEDAGVARANAIPTGFTGLAPDALSVLAQHARWQVHALTALYGKSLLS